MSRRRRDGDSSGLEVVTGHDGFAPDDDWALIDDEMPESVDPLDDDVLDDDPLDPHDPLDDSETWQAAPASEPAASASDEPDHPHHAVAALEGSRGRRTASVLAALVGALVVGLVAGASAYEPTVLPTPTVTVTRSSTITPTQNSDGRWKVGTDIEPGTYQLGLLRVDRGCAFVILSSLRSGEYQLVQSGTGVSEQTILLTADDLLISDGCVPVRMR